jgi:hypothetical protein
MLISLLGMIGKLSDIARYGDWTTKVMSAMMAAGFADYLTGETSVRKPDQAKPNRADIVEVGELTDETERERQQKSIKRRFRAWKKYEDFKKVQMGVYTCLISTICEKCEAYAEVRKNKDQDPASLWSALKERIQPSSESHYVKLLVKMMNVSIGKGGVQGVVDAITTYQGDIVSAGGAVEEQNMKLALITAISKDQKYQHTVYPELCKTFSDPFHVLAKTATDYENNMTNLLGEVDQEEGSDEVSHALVAKSWPKKKQAQAGCHHCGSTNHFIRDCPTAGPKCSKCNRRGHESKSCPDARQGKSGKHQKSKSRSRDNREESSESDESVSDDDKKSKRHRRDGRF